MPSSLIFCPPNVYDSLNFSFIVSDLSCGLVLVSLIFCWTLSVECGCTDVEVRLLLTIFRCLVNATWKTRLSIALAVLLLNDATTFTVYTPSFEQASTIWSCWFSYPLNVCDELEEEFKVPNPKKLVSVLTGWEEGVEVPKKLKPRFWTGWTVGWVGTWGCWPVCIVMFKPPFPKRFNPWFWVGCGVFAYRFNPDNPLKELLLVAVWFPYRFNDDKSLTYCFTGCTTGVGFTEGVSFVKRSSKIFAYCFLVSTTGGLTAGGCCGTVVPKFKPNMLLSLVGTDCLGASSSSPPKISNSFFGGCLFYVLLGTSAVRVGCVVETFTFVGMTI